MNKYNNEYVSGLDMKISNPPKLKTYDCFCMWSDLLGFGSMFEQTNWVLSNKQKRKVYKRLEAAHRNVLYYSSLYEHDLILNDGIAKVYHAANCESKIGIFPITIFLNSCIQLHLSINKEEKCEGYPGCRSVLSFGESIEYLSEEVRYDDYIFNYTKPEGEEISSGAKKNGNPVIIYNPKELQMNTAFSKSYLLESGGAKAGLQGNQFYIDQSVIDALEKYASSVGWNLIWRDENDLSIMFISYTKNIEDKVWMGLALKGPIYPDPKIVRYKTTIYQLVRFYPDDEKISEFYFDL